MKKNSTKFEILLAVVIACRATSFMFSKMLLGSMQTFNILAIRFIMAFLILCFVFPKRILHISKKNVAAGAAIGLMYYLCMGCELTALSRADSSLVSLLENCAIIFVPLFVAVLYRRLPQKVNVAGALIAFAGVICLLVQQGIAGGGFFFGILAAVFYSLAIIVTDKVTGEDSDPLSIGIIQLGTMGILSLITSLAVEDFSMPSSGTEWVMLLILAVLCSSFGFAFQTVAQSRVSAERAGLFCAINPAIASVLGVVVLHENMGVFKCIGLALIVASIALPHIKKPKAQRPSE